MSKCHWNIIQVPTYLKIQYFSLSPRFRIMLATQTLIDCIVLSISCCEIPRIILCALSQNCSYDSLVMPLSSASFANFLVTMWKMFSIGFKSGLCGRIFKSSQWQRTIASRAALLFCEGSLSCRQSRLNPLHDHSNSVEMLVNKRCEIVSIYFLVSFANQHSFAVTFCYHELGHFSSRSRFTAFCQTPSCQAFRSFPPYSSFWGMSLVQRINLVHKWDTIQIESDRICPNTWGVFCLHFSGKLHFLVFVCLTH